ncbi:hypothetical protein [Actinomadura kijaniata]|uniref:hypothetical protein n=1 Tax=Actinomadura kijaniata TaxID=46161 RepID=UPI00083171A4|nr:hypothetical protein [Actinomadura kijaniata]
MARTGIWVLGGHQTDFARNWARAGLEFADLTREVVDGALTAAGVGPDAVEVIHVGNAFGQLFTGQGRLGGTPVDAARQVTGVAGAYQIEGARRVGALNIGGSATTTVSLVAEEGTDGR